MWPFLITPALVAVSWLFCLGHINWLWSHAAYYGAIFRPLVIIAVVLTMAWLFLACRRGYHDRPARVRDALSAAVALVLTGIFFGFLFILIGWWSPF